MQRLKSSMSHAVLSDDLSASSLDDMWEEANVREMRTVCVYLYLWMFVCLVTLPALMYSAVAVIAVCTSVCASQEMLERALRRGGMGDLLRAEHRYTLVSPSHAAPAPRYRIVSYLTCHTTPYHIMSYVTV